MNQFKDLWVGDRFKMSDKSLWTKISHDCARKHSKESISLKENGYGYLGDTVCYFELEDLITFCPI